MGGGQFHEARRSPAAFRQLPQKIEWPRQNCEPKFVCFVSSGARDIAYDASPRAHFAARFRRTSCSRTFRVSEAARSNSARASSKRESLARRSPHTAGNKWYDFSE